MSTRVVAFVLFPDIQPLDLVGPHEVFAGANEALDALGRTSSRYQLELLGPAGCVSSESGLPLHATRRLHDDPIHTLVVPGGVGALDPAPELVAWVSEAARRADRVAAVCTGTFILAAAGLCDGKRVTTHWARAGLLATRFPNTTVDPDPIYLSDGALWTSAGVTAGIDLALALVEADHGAEIARQVARHLVVYLQRPGGQSQFAAPVWANPTDAQPIRHAIDLIHRDLAGDLSAARIAADVGLSTRHFTRRFRAEIGEPLGRHVERCRIDAARQILEREDAGLAEVALRCGFASPETLRRAFHRRLHESPAAYRRRFASTGNPRPTTA